MSAFGHAKIGIFSLRCEYIENPLGIDNSTPQLSWKLKSDGKDQTQTAYHILIASDPAKLKKNIGDLWDSGKIISNNETCIVYAGTPLASGMVCHWKVKVWDQDDKEGKWSRVGK